MLCDDVGETLGCIPYRTHPKSAQVVPQVYANIEGCRTPEVERSKELCADICIVIRLYA